MSNCSKKKAEHACITIMAYLLMQNKLCLGVCLSLSQSLCLRQSLPKMELGLDRALDQDRAGAGAVS